MRSIAESIQAFTGWRITVVPVAGVSFRPEAVADSSFDPGRPLTLVPEPDNEHDPNAIGIWNEERTLQAGYVPREVAPTLAGDELAVSLWRVGAEDWSPERVEFADMTGGQPQKLVYSGVPFVRRDGDS